jgi:hypothetical protein
VVLVTRGRARRLVAAVGLAGAVGMVVIAALGLRAATDGLREELRPLGVQDLSTEVRVWFWVYLAAAVAGVVASTLALRWVPAWPEMGARYDAPGTGSGDPAHHERTGLDLWKAMDDGRDPTLTDPPGRDP